MFTSNPFAEISASVAPALMQTYVVVMILFVAGGTLFDIIHKRSATYFFNNWRQSKAKSRAPVGDGAMAGVAIQTALHDVLASGEFCNARRRLAHLLTMYGFVLYLIATIAMVFCYPTDVDSTPGIWPFLWTLGALMVCVGGYWFWFVIRVDVAAEGSSPFRFMRADLFVVSLTLSTTFAILWALFQAGGAVALSVIFLGLYLIATTVLFGSVPWSKFSHMFFKPAAAFEKRVSEANGTRSNLPPPAVANNRLGSPTKHAHHY